VTAPSDRLPFFLSVHTRRRKMDTDLTTWPKKIHYFFWALLCCKLLAKLPHHPALKVPNPVSRNYPGQLNYVISTKSLQQNSARVSLKRYLLFPWEIGTHMEISLTEICSTYAYQCRTQSMPIADLGVWCSRITGIL